MKNILRSKTKSMTMFTYFTQTNTKILISTQTHLTVQGSCKRTQIATLSKHLKWSNNRTER